MNLGVELVGLGAMVPATIAAAATWCVLRFAKSPSWRPCGIAVAVAYAVSYALLPEWAAVWPQRHWQWLPHLAVGAAALGAVGLTAGKPTWTRPLAMTVIAVGSAYVLVPAWPDLQPPRRMSIAAIALYLSALILAVEWLALRLKTGWLLAILAAGALLVAVIVGPLVSIRFGILASMAAAAFAGTWLAYALPHKNHSLDMRSIAPLAAVLLGGPAYVGAIEPQPPLWWLLLVPATVLVVGATAARFRPYQASANWAR